MKELWNKLSKNEKIQVGGGTAAVVLGVLALFTQNWPMGVALVVGGGYIIYTNVSKVL